MVGSARHKGQDGAAAGGDSSHHFRLFGASKVRCCRGCALPCPALARPLCWSPRAAWLVWPPSTSQQGCQRQPGRCPVALKRRLLPPLALPLCLQVVIAVVASLAWMTVSSGLILVRGRGACSVQLDAAPPAPCTCPPARRAACTAACFAPPSPPCNQQFCTAPQLNKDLLSHGFHFPMALSGLGMAFSGTASYLCCRVRRICAAAGCMRPPCVPRPRCASPVPRRSWRRACCRSPAAALHNRNPWPVVFVGRLQVFRIVDAKKSVTLRFYVTKILPVGLFMALTL